jgi:microcystin degradation protein MlrC
MCFSLSVCLYLSVSVSLSLSHTHTHRCDVTQCRTIILKSKHHFRAHFESISRQIVTVDGGGLGSVILKGGRDLYRHVRRPIWPLDDINYP